MRFVEGFRDRHNGEEIWVLGCGPSLDDFPDDFFDKKRGKGKIIEPEKTTIALNWSIIAFPECTYWHCGHPEGILWMKEHNPEVFKKSLILYPLVPFFKDYPKKLSEEETLELLSAYKDDPVYLRWHWIVGRLSRFNAVFPQTIDAIIAGRSCKFANFGTITHYAIETAVVMGAKKITLIGCEASSDGNKNHAQKRGMSHFYPKMNHKFSKRLGRCRYGIKRLAEILKPHDIMVRRYFYGRGYEEI